MKVVDLHCDTLSRLLHAERAGAPEDILRNGGHIDLTRLAQGDYLLQCFAVFVDLDEAADALAEAVGQIGLFYRWMERYPDRIAPVRTRRELEENIRAGRLSAMLTVEEGAISRGDPALLRALYDLGVRMMTLTWNHENELGHPNRVAENRAESERGLKERGFETVAEMERLGLIVDVSHLSDAGFWDVCRCAKRPFVASHSNARAVCGHVRNLTDDMLRAIADHGGLAGINFCADFLDPGPDPARRIGTAALMAEHIAHIRDVAGLEVIALGSDFDGIGRAPDFGGCEGLPMLASALRRRGFTEDETEKVFHGNALRLLRAFLP